MPFELQHFRHVPRQEVPMQINDDLEGRFRAAHRGKPAFRLASWLCTVQERPRGSGVLMVIGAPPGFSLIANN
jgi:hypothetical protein